MVLENSLHDRPQISRRFQVASVTKVCFFQTGPVGNDAAALQSTTDEKGDRCGAVISALGAINARCPSELGDHSNHTVFPGITHAAFKRVGRPVVSMRVPTIEG